MCHTCLGLLWGRGRSGQLASCTNEREKLTNKPAVNTTCDPLVAGATRKDGEARIVSVFGTERACSTYTAKQSFDWGPSADARVRWYLLRKLGGLFPQNANSHVGGYLLTIVGVWVRHQTALKMHSNRKNRNSWTERWCYRWRFVKAFLRLHVTTFKPVSDDQLSRVNLFQSEAPTEFSTDEFGEYAVLLRGRRFWQLLGCELNSKVEVKFIYLKL
jgi:hypothetical protein